MRESQNQKRVRNPVRTKEETGNSNTSKHAFTWPECADSISRRKPAHRAARKTNTHRILRATERGWALPAPPPRSNRATRHRGAYAQRSIVPCTAQPKQPSISARARNCCTDCHCLPVVPLLLLNDTIEEATEGPSHTSNTSTP